MNKNIAIIFQREFKKIIRKRSFWFSTLAFPLFFFVIITVSYLAGGSLEESLQEQLQDSDGVIIIDNAGVISQETLFEPLSLGKSEEAAVERLRAEELEAVIVYPENVITQSEITVYEQSSGILDNDNFQELGREILRQNILSGIATPEQAAIISGEIAVETQKYEGEEPAVDPMEEFGTYLAPGLLVLVFFLLIILSANYFVMSVSEEKENRMIEIVLTIVKPLQLIFGKIIGLSGVALLQAAINIGLIIIAFSLFQDQVPVDTAGITVEYDLGRIALNIFYLATGFLLLGASMIAAGSVMPSAQEAGGLTSVFLLIAISPTWFFANILADPSGPLAIGTSYFPYTAPLILMMRNTLGEITGWEIFLSIGAMSLYVAIVLYLAVKLFRLGAMEYNQKLSLKRIIFKNKE